MRLLLWHCSRLAYKDVGVSTRPTGIHDATPTPSEVQYDGSLLLVFVTIEAADTPDTIPEACSLVIDHHRMLGGLDRVVLMPFAHLSAQLSDPNEARRSIEDLGRAIGSSGVEIEVA